MNYLGIDPGKSGAAALITPSGVFTQDWRDGPLSAGTLKDWNFFYGIHFAAIEKVHAMPKQGVTSSFTFGANFGWWQGLLDGMSIPYVLVRPQEWQKGIVPKKDSLSSKPSFTVARRLFPDAELLGPRGAELDGRADALLIADWLRRSRK